MGKPLPLLIWFSWSIASSCTHMMTSNLEFQNTDFECGLLRAAQEFLDQEHLVDVTLIAGDGKYIPAHKLVLASQSEYFLNLFSNDLKYEPYLKLDGVSLKMLRLVLEFVYFGRTKVLEEDVELLGNRKRSDENIPVHKTRRGESFGVGSKFYRSQEVK